MHNTAWATLLTSIKTFAAIAGLVVVIVIAITITVLLIKGV